jgi:hypothetical protein
MYASQPRTTCLIAASALLFASAAGAGEPTANSADDPSSEDRLVIAANGATMSGSAGDWGGSVNWLRSSPDASFVVGANYESLADSHWEFATGAVAMNWGRSAVYAEADEGAGDQRLLLERNPFHYAVETVGLSTELGAHLRGFAEARRIDIDTSHGNLPKVAMDISWPHYLQTTISYAQSVTGNLGTELGGLRIDLSLPSSIWFAGAAAGHASPPVVNVDSLSSFAAEQYREGFLGVSKAFRATEWSLALDYLTLGQVKRVMLNVTCTVQIH